MQLVSWATTVIVARLLTPDDYGIVGMAAVYLGFITILTEFGIGTTVIAMRDLDRDQIAQVNGLAVIFGVAALAVSAGLAVPIARFFNTPELTLVILVMSASLVIKSLQAVPLALLQRDLRFRQLAIIEAIQGITLSGTMVVLAVLGLRYWALVLGSLASAILYTGMVLAARVHPIARPNLERIRSALTFSWHIIVGRISWYTYSNTDFLVAGKLLGKTALGAYSFAWSIASLPVDKITALVVRVAQAYFSSVQDDPAELRRYLLRLTEGIAILTFPAALGIALVADPFVRVALGEKWLAAVRPLQLLALYASFRSIVALPPLVLNVTGDTALTMRVGITSAVVLTTGFVVGSQWGTAGIALVWLLVYPPLTIPLYVRLGRRCALTVGAYVRALWPAGSSAVLMATAVFVIDRTSLHWPSVRILGLEILVGAVTYAVAIWLLHRERLRVFMRLMRRGGSAGAPPDAGLTGGPVSPEVLPHAARGDALRRPVAVADGEQMGSPAPEPGWRGGWRLVRAHAATNPAVWLWHARTRRDDGPPASSRDRLAAGADWLVRAQEATVGGGISRGYGLVWVPYLGTRGWQPAYPETTGYIIPTLYELARRLGRPELATRATRAAEWEVDLLLPSGGMPGGVVGQSTAPAVFNTGQVLFGLLSAAEVTGHDRFLEAADRAASFLAQSLDAEDHWREGQGTFAQDGVVLYNARTAWAVAAAGRRLNRPELCDAALRNLRAVVRLQHANGWLPRCCLTDHDRPLLHTLAYAARGLIEGGWLLEDDDLVGAGTRIAVALAEKVGPTGHMAGRFTAQWDPAVTWSCLTGQVQMANVWLRLRTMTGDAAWVSPAVAASRFVERTQRVEYPDGGVRGGVMGAFPASGGYGRYEVLSWATKFLCDALMRLEDVDRCTSASAVFDLA